MSVSVMGVSFTLARPSLFLALSLPSAPACPAALLSLVLGCYALHMYVSVIHMLRRSLSILQYTAMVLILIDERHHAHSDRRYRSDRERGQERERERGK